MRILLTALLLFFSAPVVAQQSIRQIPAICMELITFSETLDSFGEAPFIRGNSVRLLDGGDRINVIVLFFNPSTRTWTIAERVSESVVCVLAVGHDLEPMNNDGTLVESQKYGVSYK